MPKTILALLCGMAMLGRAQTEGPEQRAAAVVSRMTLAEKIGQMQDRASAIPRLGIPAYGWWNEALHGVARNGLATVFPQAIGLAATWDTRLERRIAEAISTEARAKFNLSSRTGQLGRYQGLTFWSPNINIFRDPRWGRGQETYGEDPYLTGAMARQFILGLQGSDPHFLRTIATAKHFAVHSGPETGRHSFDAQVSESDLDDTYLRAFRQTVEDGGAWSVMCAYNRVNGAPACASADLLQQHLREKWKFRGYVVSDCGAVQDIESGHHYAGTIAEAAAKAVKAGTDLDCGSEYSHLNEAVQQGLIREEEIDRAVIRLMAARYRLGLFEPDAAVPFNRIGPEQIASPDHERLALEAAQKSMVLLKNNGALPLSHAPASIAVIGPAADDPDTLLGNYYGTPRHLITPLAGLKAQFPTSKVNYATGSPFADSFPVVVPEGEIGGEVRAELWPNETMAGTVSARTLRRPYFVWAMNPDEVQRWLPQPTFALRLSLVLRPLASGSYRLGVAHQECDSCSGTVTTRLLVDGKPLVEETRKSAGGAGSKMAKIAFAAGRSYRVEIDYQQREGGSGVELVWEPPAAALMQKALETARNAEVVVACLGLNSRLEGEESRVAIPGFSGGDRTSLDLPAGQERLLEALLDTGKPVIVVLLNGSALAVNIAAQRAAAILEAWYPGQEGGTAIAQTLAGDHNPAGRLPVTFYRSVSQLPSFTDYRMEERTYRYFNGKVLFPFGFGLSYSKFEYEKLPSTTKGRSAKVSNLSRRDSDEVAQLYELMNNGHWELAGFERLHLRGGESRTVSFPTSKRPDTAWEIAGGQPSPGQDMGHTNAPRR